MLALTVGCVTAAGASLGEPVTNVTSMAQISFYELNSTLDASYCASSDCHVGHGANFSYIIPLSPQFPLGFITMGLK